MKAYRMTDGSFTANQAESVKDWRELLEATANALDVNMVGANPGIHLIEKRSQSGFVLSPDLARRIIAMSKGGKIGTRPAEMGRTAEQWDALEARNKALEESNVRVNLCADVFEARIKFLTAQRDELIAGIEITATAWGENVPGALRHLVERHKPKQP
jgi:hypothetical protein